MTTDAAESAEVDEFAQTISNKLVDLAHWVRRSPDEARDMIHGADSIAADVRKLYALVGEP